MPSSHNFRSYVVSELVDTGELAKKLHAAHSTIDPRAAINHRISNGEMFAFNFGAIVFWNVPDEAQAAELSSLIDLPGLVKDSMCSEDFIATEDPDKAPRVEFNRILIDHLSKDRAEVITSTIAQSTTMEYYESMCEEAWTEVDGIIATLKVRGKLSPSPNKLMRWVAHCLELRSRVVRVLHLLVPTRPNLGRQGYGRAL
ncbi:RMD1 family protein [Pseudobacteriovorax antillogorgiicola]|uniref:Uncharacterized ACR, YagE family COG1723 n=1 Tax=Pseudobacteriovorax antillogorgiicola TaxID=1513793 RepID=A0A1Y6C443_9BACT|nr:RMD1 family protein [Pseudobacteriovorax antillogorgiicola]TCS51277.1 YagE family uncharacterized protein [Pseudobacteriovorax antillogorgiicola]SMF36254.1 Uncharacterised ACR, YagE family COG1723 [Pseudobacteriovorax antillogorgiicola]